MIHCFTRRSRTPEPRLRRFAPVGAGVFLTSLAACLSIEPAGTGIAAEARHAPNVLFILTDDQRADTIGALGNSVIRTPTLDRLARSGLAFRNAYILGGNVPAVCRPSRNMLLSGRTFFRWGETAPPEGPNFPTAMKRAGYETYHHGKRGNTAPRIHALFDHSRYVQDMQDRTCGEPGKEIVDRAIRFLGERDSGRPFFMYLALANPHDPRVAAPKYMDLYRRDAIPLPANYLPLHPFDNGEMTVRDEKLEAWPRTADAVRRQLHDYYATITAMDGHLGRLVDALRERGEWSDTLVIFSSDNGLAIGSHGLMGKQSVYEHSVKVPLVIAGPGVRHGQTDAFVYLHDLLPTVCELVGAAVPEGLDGRSFAAVIRGPDDAFRDAIFTAYRDVQRAVRVGPWKLIRYPQINRTQLFNLDDDPAESHDLAADPGQAERIAAMLARLRAWQAEQGDSQPLSVDTPQDPTFVVPSP